MFTALALFKANFASRTAYGRSHSIGIFIMRVLFIAFADLEKALPLGQVVQGHMQNRHHRVVLL